MIRKYFQDAGVIAFAEGLLQLRHLLLIPFITRRFGAVDYGVWSQVAVLTATLGPAVMLGTGQAAMRFFPGLEAEKQKRYLSGWVIFLLGTAFLATLPLFLFPEPIANAFFGVSEGYVAFLPLAAISLVLGQLVNVVKEWFKIVNNVILFTGTNLSRVALQLIAAVLMLSLRQGVYELVVYSLLADLILVLGALAINYRIYGIGQPDFSILPAMLRFGLPLVPLSFANWGINYIDRFFLVRVSLEAVGVYTLAYSLSAQVIPIMLRPFWAMFPSVAASLYNQGKREVLQRLYERSAGTAFLLTLPATVGLALIARRLILLLSTDQFVAGAPVVLFVGLGAMMNTFASFYAVTLGLVYKQHLSLVAHLVALVVNVVVNIVLIPPLGVLGAAIATFAAFSARLAILFRLSERYEVVHTKLGFPLKVTLATAIMAIVVLLFDQTWLSTLGNNVLEITLIAIIGALVYALALYLMKILNLENIELVRSFVFASKK